MNRGNILITGNSSGLGAGMTKYYLSRDHQVFGCSRRGCDIQSKRLHDIRCDLSDLEAIPTVLNQLLMSTDGLDLVMLNAGILGEIKELHNTSMDEIRQIMDINVWSNKVIMDWLYQWGKSIKQIVMISSGASILGNRGWGGYALSKATLNMLARLYSQEFLNTHVSVIAPGLIDSAMMDYLCVEPDAEEYPAVQRLRKARGTVAMPKPDEAARRIASMLPKLLEFDSGSYIDIRQLADFGEPVPQRR